MVRSEVQRVPFQSVNLCFSVCIGDILPQAASSEQHKAKLHGAVVRIVTVCFVCTSAFIFQNYDTIITLGDRLNEIAIQKLSAIKKSCVFQMFSMNILILSSPILLLLWWLFVVVVAFIVTQTPVAQARSKLLKQLGLALHT